MALGPGEKFVFQCLGFPVHNVPGFSETCLGIKHGLNVTSIRCLVLLPVCSFPLHPSLALGVYFQEENKEPHETKGWGKVWC